MNNAFRQYLLLGFWIVKYVILLLCMYTISVEWVSLYVLEVNILFIQYLWKC